MKKWNTPSIDELNVNDTECWCIGDHNPWCPEYKPCKPSTPTEPTKPEEPVEQLS